MNADGLSIEVETISDRKDNFLGYYSYRLSHTHFVKYFCGKLRRQTWFHIATTKRFIKALPDTEPRYCVYDYEVNTNIPYHHTYHHMIAIIVVCLVMVCLSTLQIVCVPPCIRDSKLKVPLVLKGPPTLTTQYAPLH